MLDTGPLVAYLDADDPEHPRVAERLDAFTGQLVTTSAVITEAMHFVTRHRRGPQALAEFVAASALAVADLCGPAWLAEAARRMETYHNLPMDFADATLVLLAERSSIYAVATLDRRGFSVYRSARGRRFDLVLDRPA